MLNQTDVFRAKKVQNRSKTSKNDQKPRKDDQKPSKIALSG